MPLPIAHGLLGASLVAAIHPKPFERFYLPLVIGAVLANAADFDFGFSFFFGLKQWHRGFTHSIFFAFAVIAILMIWRGRKDFREALAYGLAYASHCLLDFATTRRGNGVELFWPFSIERLGLRWFGLSEIPSQVSASGVFTYIGVEFLIFAPVFALVFWRRKKMT
jgi:inner membrane protein